ncbi:lipase family alpha/beta hydrolase [Calidifontibacillus oryziterrae]|uniref:lipase family alpha/beta hydrolase n=1 Tax=Calidifontibacillus oryziterrae TaxID=1191699 RepID=UPI0002E5D17F|nr:alpha/beta fold hydrolase [Calidifontibacillus oryziterrae]
MSNLQKIVLVHGYYKTSKDMRSLKAHLEEMGYKGVLVDLPLTFKSIDYCSSLFEDKVSKIMIDLKSEEKVHLIGHSTGGIVIRHFLSNEKNQQNVHRCVLIATPNQGSQLASIAGKTSRRLVNVFQTLRSLQPEEILAMDLIKHSPIEIGAVAGNNNNLLLGKLLKNDNDGRVTIEEVYYKELHDFTIAPFGHKDIHYQKEVAQLIHHFLQTGKFK